MPDFQTPIPAVRFVYSPFTACEIRGFAQVFADAMWAPHPERAEHLPSTRGEQGPFQSEGHRRDFHGSWGVFTIRRRVAFRMPIAAPRIANAPDSESSAIPRGCCGRSMPKIPPLIHKRQ